MQAGMHKHTCFCVYKCIQCVYYVFCCTYSLGIITVEFQLRQLIPTETKNPREITH